jgi:hypothetical protein
MSYSLTSWRKDQPEPVEGAVAALEGCVEILRQGDWYDLKDEAGRVLVMGELLRPAFAEATHPASQRRLVVALADYLDHERGAALQRVDAGLAGGRSAWRQAGVAWGFKLSANVPPPVTDELALRHGDAFSFAQLWNGVRAGADRLAEARRAESAERARVRRAIGWPAAHDGFEVGQRVVVTAVHTGPGAHRFMVDTPAVVESVTVYPSGARAIGVRPISQGGSPVYMLWSDEIRPVATAPTTLRNPTIFDVAEVDWRSAPVDDAHRSLAGKARDLAELRWPAFSSLARQVETYLERYSSATTHRDLNPTRRAESESSGEMDESEQEFHRQDMLSAAEHGLPGVEFSANAGQIGPHAENRATTDGFGAAVDGDSDQVRARRSRTELIDAAGDAIAHPPPAPEQPGPGRRP